MPISFTLSLGGDETHGLSVYVCVDTHVYAICNTGLMNYMRWIHSQSKAYVLREVQHMSCSIIQRTFYFKSPFCYSGGNSMLTSLCSHSSLSPGLRQSFRDLCSAKKLEFGSWVSPICPFRIHSRPISTFLSALELELNGAHWQESLPSGFRIELSFPIWFFFFFFLLLVCKIMPFLQPFRRSSVTCSSCLPQVPGLYTVLTPL